MVPAGYADGLDTRLCGRGNVLIRGKRVPIVGAVSMDMLTVDVTDVPEVRPGDEVVMLGRQGDESWQRIDAREMAAAIGTIPWEIVCRLGTRIEETLHFHKRVGLKPTLYGAVDVVPPTWCRRRRAQASACAGSRGS